MSVTVCLLCLFIVFFCSIVKVVQFVVRKVDYAQKEQ